MRKTIIITNSNEISSSLVRYLNYILHKNRLYPHTFNDLRIMSREIVEMDFIIIEVYRLEGSSIDDYGLDMFLSFVKIGKKGILLHIDRIENSGLGIQDSLFKLPGEMGELVEKLEDMKLQEKIELSEKNIKFLKESFLYRVVKDHHRRHG